MKQAIIYTGAFFVEFIKCDCVLDRFRNILTEDVPPALLRQVRALSDCRDELNLLMITETATDKQLVQALEKTISARKAAAAGIGKFFAWENVQRLRENNDFLLQQVDELTQEAKQSKQEVLEYKAKCFDYVEKAKKPQLKPKQKCCLTLKPNITPLQVAELWERLRNVFPCQIEQFNCLFAEQIKGSPLIVTPTISDVTAFVEFLQRYKLIGTRQPFAILEKTKAFIYEGKPLTAKQLKKPKETHCFPYVGLYYSNIEKAVSYIRNI